MHIGILQHEVDQIWTNDAYSEEHAMAAAHLPHIDASHTVLHITKAAGKVAAAIEPADHGGVINRTMLANALADLMICACRMANVVPNRGIDLESEVKRRLNDIRHRQSPTDHDKA